eukprot:1161364-Pelagomonas_calceolata.AAC.8
MACVMVSMSKREDWHSNGLPDSRKKSIMRAPYAHNAGLSPVQRHASESLTCSTKKRKEKEKGYTRRIQLRALKFP